MKRRNDNAKMDGSGPHSVSLPKANAYLSRNETAVRLHVGVTTLAWYENRVNDVPTGGAEKMAILYQVPLDVMREAVTQTQNTVAAAVSAAKREEG